MATKLLRELMKRRESFTKDHEIAYIEPVILAVSVPTEVSSIQTELILKLRSVALLGEIDICISQHPFVRENVTLVRRDKDEEPTLVTYFVPETKRWFQYLQQDEGAKVIERNIQHESMARMLRRFKSLSEDCKNFLATKVPNYAVPKFFIPLARMPLSRFP